MTRLSLTSYHAVRHEALIAAWLADPAIGRWFPGAQPIELARFLTFVIETEAQGPVGLMAFAHVGIGRSAELCCVMIGDPAARRRGLAAAAIRMAMGCCLPADIEKVVVRVAARNRPARQLYAQLGFVQAAKVAADLVLVRHLGRKMVPGDGFEPPTHGFSIRCSTN